MHPSWLSACFLLYQNSITTFPVNGLCWWRVPEGIGPMHRPIWFDFSLPNKSIATHFIKSLIVVWWPVAFCGIENLHYSSHKTFSALLHYWPFVWAIHQSLANSSHKGSMIQSLYVFFVVSVGKLLSANSWVASDLWCYGIHNCCNYIRCEEACKSLCTCIKYETWLGHKFHLPYAYFITAAFCIELCCIFVTNIWTILHRELAIYYIKPQWLLEAYTCLFLSVIPLTHWGRVTHICDCKLTVISSDNGLSPGRHQAIIWTNAGILLIGPLATNCNEIFIEIHIFSLRNSIWKCRLENGIHFVSASMCESVLPGLSGTYPLWQRQISFPRMTA